MAGGAYDDLTAHLHAAYQRLEGEPEARRHPTQHDECIQECFFCPSNLEKNIKRGFRKKKKKKKKKKNTKNNGTNSHRKLVTTSDYCRGPLKDH